MILRESGEVVRSRPPLVIAETRHGFVCASAGVDASNAPGPDTLVLLPVDPGCLRRSVCARGCASYGRGRSAVIVSDSFGRAWRQGTTDVALGVAGLAAAARPARDARCGRLRAESTQIAVADEIAGAAELVLGKTRRRARRDRPRRRRAGDGSASDLVMPRERDLFR